MTITERPSWEKYALILAEAASSRADCTRRMVGAVILDVDHHVIAAGYNGLPAGEPGCKTAGACPRGRLTYAQLSPDHAYTGTGTGVDVPCRALHAEENALLHSDPLRRRGGTIAINHEPCAGCRRLLAGSDLAVVVWPGGRWEPGMDWPAVDMTMPSKETTP